MIKAVELHLLLFSLSLFARKETQRHSRCYTHQSGVNRHPVAWLNAQPRVDPTGASTGHSTGLLGAHF